MSMFDNLTHKEIPSRKKTFFNYMNIMNHAEPSRVFSILPSSFRDEPNHEGSGFVARRTIRIIESTVHNAEVRGTIFPLMA